ncbi:MAG: hypothetical protein JWO36_7315 [Myxococcales bacterium]|nr:hypothetical protein [Myxococcales bacterium]
MALQSHEGHSRLTSRLEFKRADVVAKPLTSSESLEIDCVDRYCVRASTPQSSLLVAKNYSLTMVNVT